MRPGCHVTWCQASQETVSTWFSGTRRMTRLPFTAMTPGQYWRRSPWSLVRTISLWWQSEIYRLQWRSPPQPACCPLYSRRVQVSWWRYINSVNYNHERSFWSIFLSKSNWWLVDKIKYLIIVWKTQLKITACLFCWQIVSLLVKTLLLIVKIITF